MISILATLLTVYIHSAQVTVTAPQSGTVTVSTQPGRPAHNPFKQGGGHLQNTLKGDDLMGLPETTTFTVE